MSLLLNHPTVAMRDCGLCQKYHYDEKTGKVVEDRRSPCVHEPALGDRPRHWMRRRGPTPCRTDEGCAKGTPEQQQLLSPRNLDAYLHYLQCKAVGIFPDDPMVARNAAIIRGIEDGADISRQVSLSTAGMQASMMSAMGGNGAATRQGPQIHPRMRRVR